MDFGDLVQVIEVQTHCPRCLNLYWIAYCTGEIGCPCLMCNPQSIEKHYCLECQQQNETGDPDED